MKRAMRRRKWGLVLFGLGVFCMHGLMTANFWLNVIQVVPVNTWYGIVSANTLLAGLIWGLSPPVGAALIVVGGLVHGRSVKEESE